VLDDGRIVVYQIRSVKPGDPKEATAEQRTTLRDQLARAAALEAVEGMVRDLRRRMRITVAEDRL